MCEIPESDQAPEPVDMSVNLVNELLFLVIAITQHIREPHKEHQATMLAQMTDVINQLETDEVLPHPDFAPRILADDGADLHVSFNVPLVEEL